MRILCIAIFVLSINHILSGDDLYKEALLRIDFSGGKITDVNDRKRKFIVKNVLIKPLAGYKTSIGNGFGAVFNGINSEIKLAPGGDRKLQFDGPLVYHLKVSFDNLDGDRFLMGCISDSGSPCSVLETNNAVVRGYISKSKKSLKKVGFATVPVLQAGKFYDIFFCFTPAVNGKPGSIRTIVYDSAKGEKIAVSKNWGTSIKGLEASGTPAKFVIGCGRGRIRPFAGIVKQVNVWNRKLSLSELDSLCTPIPENSFPTEVERPCLSAAARKVFPYYNDFEVKNDCRMWKDYGRKYKVNFQGLTSEHAFSGKKSYKLDVTFEQPGRYIWSIKMPEIGLAGTSFTTYMLLGNDSTVEVSPGLAVKMKIASAFVGGCTQAAPPMRSTGGRWLRVDYGNTVATDFQRFGQSMVDIVFHMFDTADVKRDEVIPCMEKIIINIKVKKPGERLVLYLDDVCLKNNSPVNLAPVMKKNSVAVMKRYDSRLKRIKVELSRAKSAMAVAHWDKTSLKIKHALKSAIELVEKKLKTALSQRQPFAEIYPEMDKINCTVDNLRQLIKSRRSDFILFMLKDPTNKNSWVLPEDILIPGVPERSFTITGCRGEYQPVSLVVKAVKKLKALTLKPGILTNNNGKCSIPVENIDVKLVKCWYQSANAGKSINQKKTPRKLVPELLVNDPALIKVDNAKKQNYLKLTYPGKVEYRDISWDRQKKVDNSIEEWPVADSPKLLPVDVPAGCNQQFWITLHIPEKAIPGNYTGNLSLQADGKEIGRIKLHAKVLPFTLLPPYYTASIDYHGVPSSYGSISSWKKTDQQMLAELKNMVAHGLTNCQHYFAVDDASLTKVMALRKQAGMSNKQIFLKGHKIYTFAETADKLEDISRRAKHIIEQARANGANEVYFYGRDELAGSRLPKQRKAWKAIRNSGGKIYVAGGRDNLVFMGDIQDVLVKAGWPDRKHVEGWHKNGHKIFCYSNPQVGVEDPAIYRLNYGLLMWKYDYDGIADNAYQHTFGFTWNDFDHGTYRSMTFAYPTRNGVVDTIAWEGYREAVDDVRYITTLEVLVRQLEKKKTNASVSLKLKLKEAQSFISRLKNSNKIEQGDCAGIRRKIIKLILELTSLMSQGQK